MYCFVGFDKISKIFYVIWNREYVAEYNKNARKLALVLLEAISESLGLERNHIDMALGRHSQQMAINYYPPCPQPELTFGLPGHADPNALTILLQDDVPGLQVLINGKWATVHPIPNTFIINIGDQIQVNKSIIPNTFIINIDDQIQVT